MKEINATRQRILNAAINAFSQKGYHNTKVDEIVEISNSSKGAVYFHFPSKQDIFLGLVDEFANILEDQLESAIKDHESGVHRVEAALQTCLTTFGAYRKLAKIFLIQAVGLGSAFEEKRQDIHTRFVKLVMRHLDKAIDDGDIPEINTEIVAYAWMGAINEVVIRWVYTGEPTPEQALPTLRTILLRSIGVSEEKIYELENFNK